MSTDKTLCRYAWDYPIVTFHRNGLRACCRAAPSTVTSADIQKHGIELFSNFAPIVQMRKDLLNGVQTKACESCWKVEAAGGRSARTDMNAMVNFAAGWNLFGTKDPAAIVDRFNNLSEEDIQRLATVDTPRMVEIALSNVCDLKCMYCNHHYSSQWGVELVKYNEIQPHQLEEEFPKPNAEYQALFWKWFNERAWKTVTSINFIGGEPLLVDEFYEAMDRILAVYEADPEGVPSQGVTFSIVTNFNTPERQFNRFIAFLDRVFAIPRMKLDLIVSAETFGAKAQFIRTNCRWVTVDTNIRKFLAATALISIDQCRFGFIPSNNTLSISSLPEFVHYAWLLNQRYGRPVQLRQNQIVYPRWLSPSLLPASYARYIDEALAFIDGHPVDESHMPVYGKWSTFKDFLLTIRTTIDKPEQEKDHHERRFFKTRVLQLADRRHLNLYATFPEMHKFLNMIEVLDDTDSN